jgi:hypothetical protein
MIDDALIITISTRASMSAKNIKTIISHICLLALMIFTIPYSRADVIAVPFAATEEGMAHETLTMFWPAKTPKATLIFIPGGDGYLKLTMGRTDIKNQFYQMLKGLSDKTRSSGEINVVIFDSPYELPPNPRGYPSMRGSDDHLARIESVIAFYKRKTLKPIVLMGHSNGAISVTEFIRYENAKKAKNIIQGLILSSSRNGAYIDEEMAVKTSILHHKNYGCPISTAAFSESLFKSISSYNKSKTDLINLATGEAEANNPCASGFHMFNGATDEATKIIECIILQP